MTWQTMDSAPKEVGAKIMAFNGERVGEAEAYDDWCWDDEAEDTVQRIVWRWANDSCGCCWGDADPQPKLWQPLPQVGVREKLIAALDRRSARIEIGSACWAALKQAEQVHEISLVDDQLFFRGVPINPFADIHPESWIVVNAA